jgi:DivIVA domain-containing protein
MSDQPTFAILLRGYDRDAVDALVHRVGAAGDASAEKRARLRDELRDPRLPRALRGYDPREVDRYLAEAASELS